MARIARLSPTWLLSLFCLAFGIANARAEVFSGTTDPTLFTDSVDWCVQYGCSSPGTPQATPETWTSALGNTGFVGLADGFDPFYVYQQGTSWAGNLPSGMGLIYNGEVPVDIAAEFDEGLYGAGAWIQTDYYGPFTATVSLYDMDDNLLYSYTTGGISNTNPADGLFIGAYDSDPDVYAVVFDAVGTGPDEPDFGIGTLELAPTAVVTTPTPEPSSVLLLLSALGSLGIGISRKIRKSQEVSQ